MGKLHVLFVYALSSSGLLEFCWRHANVAISLRREFYFRVWLGNEQLLRQLALGIGHVVILKKLRVLRDMRCRSYSDLVSHCFDVPDVLPVGFSLRRAFARFVHSERPRTFYYSKSGGDLAAGKLHGKSGKESWYILKHYFPGVVK